MRAAEGGVEVGVESVGACAICETVVRLLLGRGLDFRVMRCGSVVLLRGEVYGVGLLVSVESVNGMQFGSLV